MSFRDSPPKNAIFTLWTQALLTFSKPRNRTERIPLNKKVYRIKVYRNLFCFNHTNKPFYVNHTQKNNISYYWLSLTSMCVSTFSSDFYGCFLSVCLFSHSSTSVTTCDSSGLLITQVPPAYHMYCKWFSLFKLLLFFSKVLHNTGKIEKILK